MRQPLRDIAAAQHGAFTTAQVMSCYSRAELRALLRSGRWARVFTGTYRVEAGEPSASLRLSAAGLSIGREVPACLHTAAQLHGFGVLDDVVTHVAVAPDEPCARRAGLWPHQLALTPDDLARLKCGALVTAADRTAVDLARTLPRIDVLPVLDAALAAGVCTRASLAMELDRHAGLRGVRQARELVPLADPASESPQESRLRLRCHEAGLPPPTLQFPVLGPGGRPRRWLDLAWEEAKVGLEYDGEQGHVGRRNLRSDRRRHNFLQSDGWAMFYATDIDVYRDYADLMRKVECVIRRRTR
jgi:Transcriptional regulator, AbiEi antitoxin